MEIPKDVGSKYRFIILAGQRVSQLQKGAKSRLEETQDLMKMTQIATRELADGKLKFNVIIRPDEKESGSKSKAAS